MAEADWSFMSGSLTDSQVRRGVSNGYTPPTGSPTASVYAMNCISNTTGAVALYHNGTGYSPTPSGKGLKITAAMKRGALGGGSTGFSAWIFSLAQGTSIGSIAYLLGVGETGHIILRKGTLTNGVPDVDVGSDGVLARSTTVVALDEWVHLWLECVVNPGNDTVLNCKMNTGPVYPPGDQVWIPIPGIDQFIDDINGINSGSPGLTLGRGGFGGWFDDANRQTYYSVISAEAQP